MDAVSVFLSMVASGSLAFTLWRSSDAGWDTVTLVWELFLIMMFSGVSVAWVWEKHEPEGRVSGISEHDDGYDTVLCDPHGPNPAAATTTAAPSDLHTLPPPSTNTHSLQPTNSMPSMPLLHGGPQVAKVQAFANNEATALGTLRDQSTMLHGANCKPLDVTRMPVRLPIDTTRGGDEHSPLSRRSSSQPSEPQGCDTASFQTLGGQSYDEHAPPQPDAPPVQTGKSHLQFKTIKTIGRSTTAGCSVNLMLTTHGQLVAGKHLTVDGQSRLALGKLVKEAEILMRLSHPCVVSIFDAQFSSPSNSVIIEELGDQGTLRSLLDMCGTLPYSVIRSYGHQITSAVAYIHSEDILHRDIKAANILLFASGDVKLTDFGESGRAHERNADTSAEAIHGSAPWMAPEVLLGSYDETASDIWSLGCTFYEMRIGRPPWEDVGSKAVTAMEYIYSLQAKLAHEEPPPMDKFTPEFTDLLKQCFKHSPAERVTASQLLSDPWFYLQCNGNDPAWDAEHVIDQTLSETMSLTNTLGRSMLMRGGVRATPRNGMLSINESNKFLTMSSSFDLQEIEVTPPTLAVALRWLSYARAPPPLSSLLQKGTVMGTPETKASEAPDGLAGSASLKQHPA